MFLSKMLGLSAFLGWAKDLPAKMTNAQKRALDQAAWHWLSQHKARWVKQESPEGERWAPNNRMWAEIKGQSTPLTGITQGTTRTWKGIQFTGNTIHMRSALQKKVAIEKVEFFYPPTVKERAQITQDGKKGAILIGFEGGKERRFVFDIPARPHTGIGSDDVKLITDTFSSEIEGALL